MKWYLALWCFFSSLYGAAFNLSNLPSSDSTCDYLIPFFLQKDPQNGALTSRFLKELATCFKTEVFIETGTHFGNTTANAAEIFSEVHSIELFFNYYEKCSRRFQAVSNVHLYLGNSSSLLGGVLRSCSKKALIYLDGHYDGGSESGKGEENTPILMELDSIRNWGRRDSVIVIDDISDFQSSLFPEKIQGTCFENYPDLNRIIEALLEINPNYQFSFFANALLAFPPTPSIGVSPFLRACTIDRLSEIISDIPEDQFTIAEKMIGQVKGAEKEALEQYFNIYSLFERQWGWKSFCGFWMGLVWLNTGKEREAKDLFQSIANHSFPNWRVSTKIELHHETHHADQN